MLKRSAIILFFLFIAVLMQAQETATTDTSTNLRTSEKYITTIANKAKSIEGKLDKTSAKALAKFKKQEEKLLKKLHKLDSNAAKLLIEQSQARYKELEEKLKNPGKLAQYLPGLDSMSTSLNFLNQNSQLKQAKDKLQDALGKVDALKAQLQKAENIKQFLKERKQALKEQFEKLGMVKQLKAINKQVYYYASQVNEYKAILNDPKKIEKKALELLSKTKIWKEFFRKNSMLASLFRLPGDPNDPNATASLAGLQTRAQVNSLIQTQIAGGGPNAQQQFQQNIQAAQSQLQHLKNKVLSHGGSSSDTEMPEGFKPNNQKTKSFWQRIELGTNIQNQRSNGLLPTTSDLGLSIGFKPNDKSIIGIGSSFKLGWGRDIRNIQITGQGLSLRSFVDYKLKGSFWISGGYEMNFRQQALSRTGITPPSGGWGVQQSGLLGVSKVVSLKSKIFKKTRLMLLWDFLSYKAVPVTQPVVFRIGYNF